MVIHSAGCYRGLLHCEQLLPRLCHTLTGRRCHCDGQRESREGDDDGALWAEGFVFFFPDCVTVTFEKQKKKKFQHGVERLEPH